MMTDDCHTVLRWLLATHVEVTHLLIGSPSVAPQLTAVPKSVIRANWRDYFCLPFSLALPLANEFDPALLWGVEHTATRWCCQPLRDTLHAWCAQVAQMTDLPFHTGSNPGGPEGDGDQPASLSAITPFAANMTPSVLVDVLKVRCWRGERPSTTSPPSATNEEEEEEEKRVVSALTSLALDTVVTVASDMQISALTALLLTRVGLLSRDEAAALLFHVLQLRERAETYTYNSGEAKLGDVASSPSASAGSSTVVRAMVVTEDALRSFHTALQYVVLTTRILLARRGASLVQLPGAHGGVHLDELRLQVRTAGSYVPGTPKDPSTVVGGPHDVLRDGEAYQQQQQQLPAEEVLRPISDDKARTAAVVVLRDKETWLKLCSLLKDEGERVH